MIPHDDELERFAHWARARDQTDLAEPPEALTQRIQAYAWRKAQEARRARGPGTTAVRPAVYRDQFLALAAAEATPRAGKARELRSNSGEWTLRLFEQLNNPDAGFMRLDVCSERAEEFEGKQLRVHVGGHLLLIARIEEGQAEGDVDLSGLDLNQALQLSID